MAHKRTGRHVGAPTREERRLAYQTKLEDAQRPVLGPPMPKGVGWGGSRVGSGRKKKEPGPDQWILVRVPFSLKLALEALPDGSLSEYVRKALDLLADILPPEKFKIIQDPLEETPSEVLPEGDTKATRVADMSATSAPSS